MDEEPPSRRGAIVTLVLLAVAVIAAIYVINRLHSMSALQDCVMSGRTNCAPVASGTPHLR